jgi:hypothetical protein
MDATSPRLDFALRFARLVYDLDESTAVRCIVGTNETNGTFRFHQVHDGEHWNNPDLDTYKTGKLIVVCIPIHLRQSWSADATSSDGFAHDCESPGAQVGQRSRAHLHVGTGPGTAARRHAIDRAAV